VEDNDVRSADELAAALSGTGTGAVRIRFVRGERSNLRTASVLLESFKSRAA
jgi:hypothetical protein